MRAPVIDAHSETWRAVRAWCLAEVETARDSLESPHAEPKTAMLRGRLTALRDMLALERPLEGIIAASLQPDATGR